MYLCIYVYMYICIIIASLLVMQYIGARSAVATLVQAPWELEPIWPRCPAARCPGSLLPWAILPTLPHLGTSYHHFLQVPRTTLTYRVPVPCTYSRTHHTPRTFSAYLVQRRSRGIPRISPCDRPTMTTSLGRRFFEWPVHSNSGPAKWRGRFSAAQSALGRVGRPRAQQL